LKAKRRCIQRLYFYFRPFGSEYSFYIFDLLWIEEKYTCPEWAIPPDAKAVQPGQNKIQKKLIIKDINVFMLQFLIIVKKLLRNLLNKSAANMVIFNNFFQPGSFHIVRPVN
jgi:hypothetical protein